MAEPDPCNRPPASSLSTSLVGRYALGVEIARGGMGAVYLADDSTLDRQVAVKVLLEELDPSSGAARRFANEARITARLQHPAIPPVHDLGILPDGRPFLAMKLIEGRTLHELLSDRADPSTEAGLFVAVFEQLCQAIAYAHSRGVIHRDLKPANVMVGRFGEVQVMDWGLAREVGEPIQEESIGRRARPDHMADGDPERTTDQRPADGSTNDRTQAGQAMGTPAYMPPEQARGDLDSIGKRSDVFALGGILCTILTGNPLYRGLGSIAITAVARSAMAVGAHPSDENSNILATTKCNLVKLPPSVSYRIVDQGGLPIIEWGSECDITAAELGMRLFPANRRQREDAKEFLRELLAEGGMSSTEIKTRAAAAGISTATLSRARKDLSIRAKKQGFGPNSHWLWNLPLSPEHAL